MKNRTSLCEAKRILKSHAGRVIVLSVLGVSTALACGWSFWTDHSVRFNSMRTGRGFYRIPPLPIEYDPATGTERTQLQIENYDDEDSVEYEEQQTIYAKPEKVWEQAIAASDAGNLSELGKNLFDYLELTKYGQNGRADFDQDQRNVSADVLDVLGERSKGASVDAVTEYVQTRISLQQGTASLDSVMSVDGRLSTLSNSDRARLADNWVYLRAAALYASDRKDESLAAFQDHSKRYPGSEKNEAALYMAGRIALEASHATLTENCGIQGENRRGEPLKGNEIEDPTKCRDEYWQSAMDRFRYLLTKYPNGRYANDARGWVAFLYKRGGERAEALAEYYRLLGQTKDPRWRLEAKKSLQIIGHEYDDETLDRVETLIADEPDAALAYAYHRIYNFAIDRTYEEFNDWCCYGENSWSEEEKEKTRVRTQQEKGEHELERVARFSTAMVKRYGSNRVSGDFLLRIAQAQLELQNFPEALTFADKSLAAGVIGDSRAQVLWVKGSSEHQSKKLAAAKHTFTKLVAEFPKHKLTEGARRLLAMTAEDQGDLESALDIYFELGYKQDVAYFVDVLFPTDRFARYVAARTSNDNYPILLYSLGIRYMREGRWAEARETLGKVTTTAGGDNYLENTRDATWYFPKEPGYGEDINYIKKSWVLQDLKTIDILEYHEKQLEAAQSDEAWAEAMYQLASAYFELDDLAFYNPAMWNGGRTSALGELQFSAHERLPNETRMIFDHLQAHDPWAKAIPIYEELIAKYPGSKVARDALYTVAVAHEKLEGRNSVWSEIYRRGLFAGPRKVTYNDVRNIFPDYQLPRGTYGWKPSTRTVNDGPGWAPKPKPLPKLTTEQRVVRKVEKWADKYGATVWEKVVAVKNGVKDAAVYVSDAIAGYLQNYYYLVYTGFLGAIFWANRKEIYEGPVTKGSLLVHRGLTFLGRHVRGWWAAVGVPWVIRVRTPTASEVKKRTTPAEAATPPS